MAKYYNYDTGKFRGYCVRCGMGAPKRDLDRVLCKNGRYGTPKTMAYLCRDCMSWLADTLGVELPDMEAVERRGPYNSSCAYASYVYFGKRDEAGEICDPRQIAACRKIRRKTP